MRLFGKTAIVVGMAGAMALGSMTASQARSRGRVRRLAGFAPAAAIGAAAANANSGYYYGSGYGYDSYAYAPGYSERTATVYEPAIRPTVTAAMRTPDMLQAYGYNNNGPGMNVQLARPRLVRCRF